MLKSGYPLKKCSIVRCTGRGRVCSSLIALAIIGASGGSAPAWLETSSAPPSAGTFSMPSTSGRNQKRYRNSLTVLSSRPSTRSERPQSLTWRSTSAPGRYGRRSRSGAAGSGACPPTVDRRSATLRGAEAELGGQLRLEVGPAVGAHDVLGLAEVAVPGVQDRRRRDAFVDG